MSKLVKYTTEEKNFLTKNYSKIGVKKCSEALSRSRDSVRVMASKLGVTSPSVDFLPGTQFGRLTITGKTEKVIRKSRVYSCLCVCGKEVETSRQNLQSGHTKSCGCLHLDSLREAISPPPGESALNQKYYNCKNNASKRGYLFLITKDQHNTLVQMDCYYCGNKPVRFHPLVRLDGSLKKISYSPSQAHMNTAWTYVNTVDRKDNSQGYTVENCVAACKACNLMKNVFFETSFLHHIEKIYSFQKNSNGLQK